MQLVDDREAELFPVALAVYASFSNRVRTESGDLTSVAGVRWRTCTNSRGRLVVEDTTT